MGENIDKKISKNLRGKCSEKPLNNLQQMHLKLLQKEQLKIAEATGDLIGNKIPELLIKLRKSQTPHYRII